MGRVSRTSVKVKLHASLHVGWTGLLLGMRIFACIEKAFLFTWLTNS